MVYSNSVPLQALYARFQFVTSNNKVFYNDDDYITIQKRNKSNGRRIYALITEDWLINKDELENTTMDDIMRECDELKKDILSLMDIYEKDKTYIRNSVFSRIKLLQYKLSCLEEYCKSMEGAYQNSKQYDNNCSKKKVRNINDN